MAISSQRYAWIMKALDQGHNQTICRHGMKVSSCMILRAGNRLVQSSRCRNLNRRGINILLAVNRCVPTSRCRPVYRHGINILLAVNRSVPTRITFVNIKFFILYSEHIYIYCSAPFTMCFRMCCRFPVVRRGGVAAYVRPGPKADALRSGNENV